MVAFAAGALASLAGGIGTAATTVASGVGSIFGGATAAGTTAAAGTSLFSGATPSIFGSILQGGAGLVGAMGAVRQGQQQAESLNMQASTAELDAAQQDISATQQTTGLKRQLVATLGQRDVAYGASGVDLSFGTPVAARSQAISDASDAISATDDNAQANKQQLLARASAYRGMASDASAAGDITATGLLLGTGAKELFGSGRGMAGV